MAPHALISGELQNRRVDWVDYAKGLCIIFVVMMHATLGVEKHAANSGLVLEGTTGWMNVIVTFAQPFRMPDFFMISGLFLGLVITRPWLRYLDRKVVHFAYFYALWLVIQFAFRSIGWIGEGYGLTDILSFFGIALYEPYGTLWFIYMLPVFFMITRLLEPLPWWLVLGGAAVLEIAPIHTGMLLMDEFAARYVYFFAGYTLARPIFNLAAWAQEKPGKTLVLLIFWACTNGAATLLPLPHIFTDFATLLGVETPTNLAAVPLFSLAFGAAGAFAIISLTALLSRLRFTAVLSYLGRNSIVVYLAFFLPMVITREILIRLAPSLDLGTMSLAVLIVSIVVPVIAWEATRITGWFNWLFVRPKWAKIERGGNDRRAGAALQAAE